jgi:hypothetical protein
MRRSMRLGRLKPLLLLLVCALLAAGCGNRQETVTAGDTEGIYLDLDHLKYQVQISRYLNPDDVEDREYLLGLPPNTQQPTGEESWFGVFLRVQNTTDEEIAPANDFEIVDTQENVYRPIPLDPAANPFAYRPDPVPPHSVMPPPDSAAAHGGIQGSLLLFRLRNQAFQFRPLELRLRRGNSPETAVVDLDV